MYLTGKDMQNILSNRWITKYYNIQNMYLCVYIYTSVYEK